MSRLEPAILDALRSPEVAERLEALSALEIVIANADEVTVAAARRAVGTMLEDDSREVREAAAAILADPDHGVEPESSRVAPPPEGVDTDRLYEAEPFIASDYWTVTDELGYAPYVDAIAEFLQHGDTKPPLTIGIKAPWGAGKTSLMRMVQERLDPPTATRRAVGEDRRQPIGLTPESRMRILGVTHGRRWRFSSRDTDARDITYGRLLRRLSQESRSVPAGPTQQDHRSAPPGDDLKLEPPPGETWRPTVWFNPWMYQSGEQVWAGLANEVISQLTDRMSTLDREAFWLELNLRRINPDAVRRRVHQTLISRLLPLLLLFGVVLAGSLGLGLVALLAPRMPALDQLVTSLFASGLLGALGVAGFRTARFLGERVTGPLAELLRQPDYAAGWDKLAREGANGSTADLFRDPRYETRLGFLYLVQTDMRRVLGLIATPQRPVVVFVDDLDRCSPGVVSQVIEAINLFLAGQFPNCVFVIAMEPEMVAAHVEVAYQPLVAALAEHDYWGDSGTLGWKFLDKIIQLPLTLPSC